MSTRALPLPPAVFNILSGLIEERVGLFFAEADATLLSDKVTPRAIELGFDSLLDYYYYLRYDAGAEQELQHLADALVVNETYIGRELEQLTVLVESLLPRMLEQKPRVRIWSAACSTGEEPVTLAGLLADRGLLPRVELVASDVSERALKLARAGKFSGRALRALPPAAQRWLAFDGGVAWARPELLGHIGFQRVNLNDHQAVQRVGPVDVVICRNVLIYFRDSRIKAVIQSLSDALVPGGYLLVGASESLLRFGESLRCEEHGGSFFYRKDGV